MQAVVLTAAGQDGVPGTQGWDGSNDYQAPTGANGRHGRDASYPTAGAPGGNLHVDVTFDPSRPGLVQVAGQGRLMGSKWEISGEQNMLLDCRGGGGGNGGFGENGQHGGHGYNGRDATRYSAGGDGGPGGHGGKGTSGAEGGAGGGAHVSVTYDDLDTLIGVDWDVSGGKGGAPGDHGNGGDGGTGGSGGAGYFWTESIPYSVYRADGSFSHTAYHNEYHSNPGGRPGRGGDGGSRYIDPLFSGANGTDGYTEVSVLGRDNSRAVYSSRYMLVVSSFDVIDENEDMIMEPGEHLIVKNIVVQNIGGMPSPGPNTLKIMIRSTKWLDPVMEPLWMPGDIPPGHSVTLPGTLRAYIKNEYAPENPRAPGTVLRAKDVVQLGAYSERLRREVPEFRGGVPVVYEYPLVMSVPRYLDCVAKGDWVRFSWTVQNISKKPYGRTSAMGRIAGSFLTDQLHSFEMSGVDPKAPHELTNMVELIEPGGVIPLTVSFQVSEAVEEYSTGNMVIKLKLADPRTGEMRTIVTFDLRIQISPSYRYNPSSRFLLVITAQCRNSYVRQVIDFIEKGLHLGVDVFNLSLSGSFMTTSTREEVLPNYSGKTILIIGNTMNYFQNGTREPWNLLDLDQTARLARDGTSFLFLAPTNAKSLGDFARLISIPNPATPHLEKPESRDLSDIVHKLAIDKPSGVMTPNPVYTLPVKKPALRSLEKQLQSKAKKIQTKLDTEFPLRRFLVVPCDPDHAALADPKKANISGVAISEGLSYNAKLVASCLPYTGHTTALTDYDIVMIMHSLPFKQQCAIFWNLLGMEPSAAVSADAVYAGDVLRSYRKEYVGAEKGQVEKLVHGKACQSIGWSLATQLASELAHFCVGSPWPDTSRSQLSLTTQLSKLSYFIATAPKTLALKPEAGTPALMAIIGLVRGILLPRGFGQWMGQKVIRVGNRKRKVRGLVSRASEPLTKLCVVESRKDSAPEPPLDPKKFKKAKPIVKNKSPKEEIDSIELRTKEELKKLKKEKPQFNGVARVHALACTRLAQLTGWPGAAFMDVNDLGGIKRSVAKTRVEVAKWRSVHSERRVRLDADVVWSHQRLCEMVMPGRPEVEDVVEETIVLPNAVELEDPGNNPSVGGGASTDLFSTLFQPR
ncbi:hypothetical protein GQ53DRAFT_888501 [Thozetella sp. PMI_491]|nr:hypothetical protein GQ53DRAFT_888501 [Thozetella sp. PMI_491]